MSSNFNFCNILTHILGEELYNLLIKYKISNKLNITFNTNLIEVNKYLLNTYYGYITYFIYDTVGFKKFYHQNKKNLNELLSFYIYYKSNENKNIDINDFIKSKKTIKNKILDNRITNYEYLFLKCFQHEIYYNESFELNYEENFKFYNYCKVHFNLTIEMFCNLILIIEQFGDNDMLYILIYNRIRLIINT